MLLPSIDRLGRSLLRGGFLVLLFVIPFSKAAIEILFPLLLGAWLIERWRFGWRSSVWWSGGGGRSLWFLSAYMGACLLSIVFSSDPRLSARGFVGKTLEYSLLFLIAADAVRDPIVARRWVSTLMCSAFLVALIGVGQELASKNDFIMQRVWYYQGPGLASRHYRGPAQTPWDSFLLKPQVRFFRYGRMTGPYENPIDLATYLMVIIPIVLASTGGIAAPAMRWVVWGLLALLIACFVRVESQGAWIGLITAMGLIAVWGKSLRRRLLLGGLLVLGMGGFFLYRLGRLDSALTFADIGMRDRLFMWQAGWRMFLDRPLVGQGLNTFMANYLTYWVGGEQQPRYAHNCFLQVAAETGLIGFMTFSGLLVSVMWQWWRSLSAMTNVSKSAHAVLIGLGAALAGFLVQSAFDTNFYAMRQAVLFWTMAGLALGIVSSAQMSSARQPSS